MSYLSQATLMANGDFVGRVGVACLTAAAQIITEDGFNWDAPTSSRHRLAGLVARGNQTGLDNFVRACGLNKTISSAEESEHNSSKDDDLQYVVNSNWDNVANIVARV